MEKFRILCGDKGVDQLFWDLSVGDGDSVVHQKFSDDLVFFRVNDGVSVEISLLQGGKIRKAMRVIEKEQGAGNEKQKQRKDEGVNKIKSRPSFSSFWGAFSFIHERRMNQKREDPSETGIFPFLRGDTLGAIFSFLSFELLNLLPAFSKLHSPP